MSGSLIGVGVGVGVGVVLFSGCCRAAGSIEVCALGLGDLGARVLEAAHFDHWDPTTYLLKLTDLSVVIGFGRSRLSF